MMLRSRSLILFTLIALTGCAGANPFVTARFFDLEDDEQIGGGGGNPSDGGDNINSTCDLPDNRRFINSFTLANVSTRRVSYAVTLMATAGSGGFVCDADLTDYLNAGYRALPLDPVTLSATIGCDPVRLQGGTQLLGLTITGEIAPDPTANVGQLASPPLNGATAIPLPQLIVLGNNTPNFICQGNDVCSQGGFAYTNEFGTLVSKIPASRTQGTVCNVRVGNRPEWLLFDVNQDDADLSAFHYTAGGSILVAVLNRADNSDPLINQVVWNVFGLDGTVLHAPQP